MPVAIFYVPLYQGIWSRNKEWSWTVPSAHFPVDGRGWCVSSARHTSHISPGSIRFQSYDPGPSVTGQGHHSIQTSGPALLLEQSDLCTHSLCKLGEWVCHHQDIFENTAVHALWHDDSCLASSIAPSITHTTDPPLDDRTGRAQLATPLFAMLLYEQLIDRFVHWVTCNLI